MGWISAAVGGGIGALLGGPVGAAIGAVAAGSFFSEEDNEKCPHCNNSLQITDEHKVWKCPDCDKWFISEYKIEKHDYIIMLFSMLAKMAKIDGIISKEETKVVSQLIEEFSFNENEKTIAKDSFNNAKNDDKSIYFYANILVSLYDKDDRESILSSFYYVLCEIAMSDGILDKREEEALKNLPFHMNISSELFNIFKKNIQDSEPTMTIEEYFIVLDCDTNATNQEIKKAYRKKAKEFHPDIISSKNLPEKFAKFANEQLQIINEAYEVIKKSRKF